MKKYIYTVGTASLALLIAGLPAAALAENKGVEVRGGVSGEVRTQGLTATQVSVTAAGSEEQQRQLETTREQQKQDAEVSREQQKQQLEQGSSTRPSIVGANKEDGDFDLEENEDGEQATSNDDLKMKIEVRKHELSQEIASSTPDHQNIVENTNPVRLAVHTLLASRDLLDAKGGIGQQVSEVAKEMNHSIASTTEAEAKIQSRGFLARLFFGGDTTSADVIAQQAIQNQARIDNLTVLLGQASTTEAVKVTLNEQIAALKEAQIRLQDLANKEKSAWGLFSWRF